MKIGAIFPHLEIGDDPIAIRDWAQTAEQLGYSHLIAYDHVIGAVHADRDPPLWGPYTEDSAFHEPFVLFGYLAALTTRLELVTGVLILPQRQTILVAKQAAEIDILSGGRFRLGVGTGWNYVEYDSLNESFSSRGRKQEEQIDLMRKLWAEKVLDYSGEWHRVERAGLKPLPGRQIPIWFGGFNDVAFRRAARIGDGFIFGSAHEANLEALKAVRQYVADTGRNPSEFGIEAMVNWHAGPDQWRREVQDWCDVGADYVSMRDMSPPGNTGMSPQEHIEALQTYWEAVKDLAD